MNGDSLYSELQGSGHMDGVLLEAFYEHVTCSGSDKLPLLIAGLYSWEPLKGEMACWCSNRLHIHLLNRRYQCIEIEILIFPEEKIQAQALANLKGVKYFLNNESISADLKVNNKRLESIVFSLNTRRPEADLITLLANTPKAGERKLGMLISDILIRYKSSSTVKRWSELSYKAMFDK